MKYMHRQNDNELVPLDTALQAWSSGYVQSATILCVQQICHVRLHSLLQLQHQYLMKVLDMSAANAHPVKQKHNGRRFRATREAPGTQSQVVSAPFFFCKVESVDFFFSCVFFGYRNTLNLPATFS